MCEVGPAAAVSNVVVSGPGVGCGHMRPWLRTMVWSLFYPDLPAVLHPEPSIAQPEPSFGGQPDFAAALAATLDGASAVLAVAARDATHVERVRFALGGAAR